MKPTLLLLLFPIYFLHAQVSNNSNWAWMNGDSILNQPGFIAPVGLQVKENKPCARHGAVKWTDANGNFWLYGGTGWAYSNRASLNEMWKFEPLLNEWTCLKDRTPSKFPVYGVRGFGSPGNTPGSRINALSWTGADGYLYLFGGVSQDYYNDLWKYDTQTNIWTWLKGDSIGTNRSVYGVQGIPGIANNPGSRNGADGWADADGKLWLMGGYGYTSTDYDYLNDVWKYDPISNNWTWVKGDTSISNIGVYGKRNIESPANHPGGRAYASAWTDSEGNFWLYGGEGYDATTITLASNDLWKYNPVTNNWAWVDGDSADQQPASFGTRTVPAASNHPGGRSKAVNWTDAAGNFWMMGGYGYTNTTGFREEGGLNDVWKFDKVTKYWTWVKGDTILFSDGMYGRIEIPDAVNNPPARAAAVSWTDAGGNLWLMGGYRYNGHGPGIFGFLNDLWRFSDASILLPVKSITFNARRKSEVVELQWATVAEENSRGFEIQRKNDDNPGYHNIAFVSSKAVTGYTSKLNYQYNDLNDATSITWYRLRQIDTHGKEIFSEIKTVNGLKTKSGMAVYPNPSKGETVTVSFTLGDAKDILLSDINGRVIQRWIYYKSEMLKLRQLKTGTYLLQVKYADNQSATQKIIVTE
jgi:N-acetylneuraminic acid mutarotase